MTTFSNSRHLFSAPLTLTLKCPLDTYWLDIMPSSYNGTRQGLVLTALLPSLVKKRARYCSRAEKCKFKPCSADFSALSRFFQH